MTQSRTRRSRLCAACAVPALLLAACSKAPEQASKAPEQAPAPPSGPRAYISNETSGDMTIIDLTKLEAVATVPLGKRPRGIHASPDGQTIYVALSGTPPAPPGVDESTLPPPDKSADGIGVWDVKQNKLVRMMQGGSDPENFAVSPDGKTIYVSNEDASGVSFIDIASGKVTQTIRTGEEPEGVTLTADGKRVFATSEDNGTLSAIDVADAKLIKTFKVGRRPRNIVFLPDGLHGYCNAENDGSIVYFDASKYQAVKPISLGKPGEIKPMGLALSPDGAKLYVTTGRGHMVFVVDTATNKPVGSFEVGQRPWGIGLTADGKTLITANGPSNDVSIVDAAAQTVTKKIKAGGGPWGVLILQ
jgi:YVTN family beta-propeller protein